MPDASLNLEEVLQSGKSIDPVASDPVAAFGRITGTITIAGETRTLDGGRTGRPFVHRNWLGELRLAPNGVGVLCPQVRRTPPWKHA